MPVDECIFPVLSKTEPLQVHFQSRVNLDQRVLTPNSASPSPLSELDVSGRSQKQASRPEKKTSESDLRNRPQKRPQKHTLATGLGYIPQIQPSNATLWLDTLTQLSDTHSYYTLLIQFSETTL